jgi:hypothetical protein
MSHHKTDNSDAMFHLAGLCDSLKLSTFIITDPLYHVYFELQLLELQQ